MLLGCNNVCDVIETIDRSSQRVRGSKEDSKLKKFIVYACTSGFYKVYSSDEMKWSCQCLIQ